MRASFQLRGVADQGSTQMPRQPVDLQAVTTDVKESLRRITRAFEDITEQTDPILADPRAVFIELVLCEAEIKRLPELYGRPVWSVGSQWCRDLDQPRGVSACGDPLARRRTTHGDR
jgi:hypothetical protein